MPADPVEREDLVLSELAFGHVGEVLGEHSIWLQHCKNTWATRMSEQLWYTFVLNQFRRVLGFG